MQKISIQSLFNLCLTFFLFHGPLALAETPTLYHEGTLFSVLWEHSPELQSLKEDLKIGALALDEAGLFPNPELHLEAETLPIGGVPKDIHSPFRQGPEWKAGLSWTIEMGKRASRRKLAEAEIAKEESLLYLGLQTQYFELLSKVGEMALAKKKEALFDGLLKETEALVKLQEIQLEAGDISEAALVAAQMEEENLLIQREEMKAMHLSLEGECSAILGLTCEPMSLDEAKAWLKEQLDTDFPAYLDESQLEKTRWELRLKELEAHEAKAQHALAQKTAIPDLDLGFMYSYNSFPDEVVHSIELSLSIPLPLANRGQVDMARALREESKAKREWALEKEQIKRRYHEATRQLKAQSALISRIEMSLKKGEGLNEILATALQNGAGNLSELILARRSQKDLEINELEAYEAALTANLELRKTLGLWPLHLLSKKDPSEAPLPNHPKEH